MSRITVQRMESLVRGFSIGQPAGLTFLPPPPRVEDTEAGIALLRAQRPDWLPVNPSFLAPEVSLNTTMIGGIVNAAHQAYYESGRGRRWIRQLPTALQQIILRDRYLFDGTMDGHGIAGLQLAGFDAFIRDDDNLLHQVETAFRSNRLAGIHQWGYLEYVTLNTNDRWLVITDRSPHSRQIHMRDAYALMCLITHNARLPQWVRIVLRVAALTHDVFTIAGGDSMKWCDPEGLHEEKLYASELAQTGWSELAQRLNLPVPQATELLIETVQGRGRYRHALKLVDWLAYLTRDAEAYRQMPQISIDAERTHAHICGRIAAHPRLCGLWDDIYIEDDHVFFTDVARYEALAEVRMLLYHELYLHPRMRYLEYLMASVVGKALYENGQITKTDLLHWSDHNLDRVFCEALDVPSLTELHQIIGHPSLELYKTPEEGLRREAELLARGVHLVFLENLSTLRIKPGIDFQVRTTGGSIKPFHDVRPGTADDLQRCSTLVWPVRLYYVENAKLPAPLVTMLAAYHARRRNTLTLTTTPEH